MSRFIIDQVVLKEGKLRDLFVEKIVRKNGDLLLGLLNGLQSAGVLRANLDTKAALVSLLSLVAFPFVAAPIMKQAFGFDIRSRDMEEWIEHSAKLFLSGTQVKKEVGDE